MLRIVKVGLIVSVFLLSVSFSTVALSKIGSTGSEVTQIQNALKEKGYYNGNVDGIFGTATKNAVTKFQQDNGLKVDGMAGTKTMQALKIENASNTSYGGYSSSDYELLARIISAEARGENYLGQVAVGAVILNRTTHPSFPDTLSGVIYQNGAFSCINDGQFYEPVADSAYGAARDAINGLDPSGGAIYYYNPATSTNKWIRGREVVTTIGNHVFCN